MVLVSVLYTKNTFSQISDLDSYEEQIARSEYPTTTLYNLWKSSEHDQAAISEFLSSISEQHIIEPIENDTENVLVTYFALGDAETDYILQAGGPDFYGLRFKRLGETDLYFCTQKVPSDAIFIYGFNEFKLSKEGHKNKIAKTSMEHTYDGTLVAPNAKLSPYQPSTECSSRRFKYC